MREEESHTPRERIALHLEQADVDTARAVNIPSGEKACYDHDTRRPPTEWDDNYGIYSTARDTLVILDIDDYRDLPDDHPGVAALDDLPVTLTQASPHGGEHRIYKCPISDDGRLPAAVFDDELGTPNPIAAWGETMVANKYIVGAGSELAGCDKDWHDCSPDGEGQYTLECDEPIATISIDEMLDVLLADPDVERDETESEDTNTPTGDPGDVDVDMDDDRLQYALERDDDLRRLYNGNYGGDRSKKEATLAAKLTFWLGGEYDTDAERERAVADALDSSDALKWHEREDDSYRDSILSVVRKVSEYYDPDAGWQSPPSLDAVRDAEATATATTDGGVVDGRPTPPPGPTDSQAGAESPAEPDTETGELNIPESVESKSIEDRIRDEVLLPYDPPEEMADEIEEIKKQTAIDRTARIFEGEWTFLCPTTDVDHWVTTLHYYDEDRGVYRPSGEEFVKRHAERLLGDFTGNKVIRELVGKLERRNMVTEHEIGDPDPWRLVVTNGILDLRNGELDEYTPEEHHRVRLDVAYDPDAETDAIDDFFHDIVSPSNVPTLYRLVAHCVYRDYDAQKAAMLVGDGQNGKSVFMNLLEEFLGARNVAGRSLQDLVENRFAAQDLHGSLANLHPDMSSESVDDTSEFKNLTGDERVTADVKFEEPVRFWNHATMIFSANGVPELDEDNHAIWRRWIYINFPNTFTGEDKVPKRVLMRQITAEEELQGLLVRCVKEIGEWWDGRDWFPSTPNAEQTREQMKRAAEPVYNFATACLEDARDDPDAKLPKEMVRKAYRRYAREEDLPTMADNVFGEELQSIRDYDIEEGRSREVTEGPDRVRVYKGIQLTDRGEQVLGIHDSDEDASLNADDLHYDDDDDGDAGATTTSTDDVGGDSPSAEPDHESETDAADDEPESNADSEREWSVEEDVYRYDVTDDDVPDHIITRVDDYLLDHPDAGVDDVIDRCDLPPEFVPWVESTIETHREARDEFDPESESGLDSDGLASNLADPDGDVDPVDELGEDWHAFVRDRVANMDAPTVGDILSEFSENFDESDAAAIQAVIDDVHGTGDGSEGDQHD